MTRPIEPRGLRIAIVGGGVSGLVCAHLLHRHHDVTLFEAADRAGGHAHTVPVADDDGVHQVDTGFIVFNDRNYPGFVRLLERLGIASNASAMRFSVHCERTGIEWEGSGPRGLFVQRRNLLRPAFWRMLADIVRFNRQAARLARHGGEESLAAWLARGRWSRSFVEHYLLPMGAAIWSTDRRRMLEFPARFFARFFAQHGMLDLGGRPQWRTVRGGSARYVERIVAPLGDRVRLRTPVHEVRRQPDGVELRAAGQPLRFDRLILATHSDQALRLLADASPAEREVLGAMPYVANRTVLHTDDRVLPERPRARASWNYRIPADPERGVTVTYSMNRLQRLTARRDYCVSLNLEAAIDPERVIGEWTYEHPLYTVPGIAARERRQEIDGQRHTYYCGAYWGNGFHEDGLQSALGVCRRFGEEL